MDRIRRMTWLLVLSGLLVGFAGCGDEDDDDDGGPVDGISGELTTNLTAGGSPYLVTGDIVIPEDATVTVDPGVVVEFYGNYKFEVRGKLVARGSESNFIHFKAQNPPSIDDRGAWRGIWLLGCGEGSGNVSELEYVRVSHAGKYNLVQDTSRTYISIDGERRGIIDTTLHRGGITVRNCAPVIERCVVELGGYDGIHVVGKSPSGETPVIRFNTIVMNAFNGIRIEPDWEVYQTSGQTEGVGTAEIYHNIIVENDDAGIRLPENPDIYDLGLVPTLGFNNIYNNASLDYVPPSFRLFPPVGIEDDIHVPPIFEDIEMGDYRLHPCSGVIDKGDPAQGQDPDGTRLDLGAYWLPQGDYHLSNRLEGAKLTLDNDEYVVRCNAFVEEGDVLTISPGTTVRFEGRYSLHVRGEINAVGTPSNPITFTSMAEEPQRGDWRQIVLDHATDNSVLENVVIEYASVERIDKPEPDTLGALSLINSSPTLRNITLREVYYAGLFFFDSSSPQTVENIVVDGAGMHGIVCELNSAPNIAKTIIRHVNGYGMMFMQNSSPSVRNVLIHDAKVAGLMMSDLSSPNIEHMTFYGLYDDPVVGTDSLYASLGAGMTRYSSPTITNSIFAHYRDAGMQSQVSSNPVVSHTLLFTARRPAPANLEGNFTSDNLFESDPLFVNPAEGDFNLRANSAGSNAGDDGTDLGAYGGTDPL